MAKKRTMKRRVYRKKGIAQKVNKLYRIVKHNRPEIKFTDNSFSVTPTYNGSLYDISSYIAQGVQENQRLGADGTVKGCFFRFSVTANGASAFQSQTLRFLLVVGKYENGTALTISDVLASTGSSTAVNSQLTFDKRRKYIVKKDFRTVVCTGNNGAAVFYSPGTASLKHYNFYVPMKSLMVQYAGNTTTVNNHGIYLILISDVAAQGPTVNGTVRTTFTDA